MEKTTDTPLLLDNDCKTEKTINLEFCEGKSNKTYFAELQLSIKDCTAQIHTKWGAIGKHQTEDWRYYSDQAKARKEFESIVKSKIKKGYEEV